MEVPVGFKFCPTEKELILYLYGRNVRGQSLTDGVIDVFDIYEYEPWNFFNKESSEVHYVFTKLKKTGKWGVDRTAGCGAWDNRDSHPIKDHNGNDIVLKTYLVFEEEEDHNNKNGSWVMHEFSLLDQDLSDYVLCEIRNKEFDKESRKLDDVIGNQQKKSKTEEEELINIDDLIGGDIQDVGVIEKTLGIICFHQLGIHMHRFIAGFRFR